MYSIEMSSSRRLSGAPSLPIQLPDHLHQAVWAAHGLVTGQHAVQSTGHPSLDEALPGGGWPLSSLIELMQPQPAQGEWRLLAPALSRMMSADMPVLLVNPPHEPSLLGLQQQNLPAEGFIRTQTSSLADGLWVLDQALKADCFGAILAWLPHAPAQAFRRLQTVAARHAGLLFAFRESQAARFPSAAPLRLALSLGPCPHPLHINVLKRRGSPWPHTIVLPAWPDDLSAVLPRPHAPELMPKVVSHVALDRTFLSQQYSAAVHD